MNKNNSYINIVTTEIKNKNMQIEFDAPEPWGLFFQDNATPQMEGLEELHNNIMFYLCIILFAVTWIMISIVLNYQKNKTKISNKYVNHGTLVELIWTITPALILILIAFPSFKLLYLMDEVIDPSLVIYGEGHQWYWSYQYPDFVNEEEEFIEFDSYIVPESDLEKGQLRMLEVDNRVIIPELTHTRFIVAGADVIHSYACPSLGVKCDAYPGRLNQSSVYLNREGTYFGQCSEICGILHSAMPISIQSVDLPKMLMWIFEQFVDSEQATQIDTIIASGRNDQGTGVTISEEDASKITLAADLLDETISCYKEVVNNLVNDKATASQIVANIDNYIRVQAQNASNA